MKILYKYIIKDFLKPLSVTTIVFGGLVLISEFFREMNYYLEQKTSFIAVGQYLLLSLPWWTIQVLPVSVLLAVLFSLGQLARHNEITAIKAAGISTWRIIALFLSLGLIIGIADTLMRETLVPLSVEGADRVRREKIHHEKPHVQTEYSNLVVSVPDNGRMTIGYLNTRTKTMKNIVLDYYDDEFNLRKQVVAGEGKWNFNSWMLANCVERTFSAGTPSEKYYDKKLLLLTLRPDDFIINRLRPEQMTTARFLKTIDQYETLGIPATKDRIQLHLRYASAFSHLIVMLIGLPFAFGVGSKYGKFVSFTFALIFAFIYWGAQAVGQSLGENNILSPALAAWLGNIIFGVFGIYFIVKTSK